ncbi:MAG: FAD-binding oxidoreductase, partial [Caulobacteraceae bacterium]|nr:FAD-binding oxidoreductase [Caulobacter sp.]
MIPRLPVDTAEPLAARFCDALRAAGFAGDCEGDTGDRAVFATDNSIYYVPPAAVVFPRSAADVVLLAQVAAREPFAALTFAPRGGGTGTNGQSLTPGIAVDLSRHMTRILAIDPVRRRVRVEAGVVKDQLNAALKPYGLFFAPELSTSNRATIGGMISTDASGQGSCLYGKTHDHVIGLTTVLLDGTVLTAGPCDPAALDLLRARDDRVGAIHRAVDDIQRRDG